MFHKDIDWPAVKVDYEDHLELTLEQIAEKHGTSRAAISARLISPT